MNAEEWLEQIKWLDERINAKLAEREQLMALATKVTPSMDGMPHGGGVTDKVGNIAVKLTTLAEETNALVDQYVDQRREVIKALEQLPNNEYTVLHKHYVQFRTWESIADEMDISAMTVWRYKVSGLKNLSRVMECYIVPMVQYKL